MAKSLYSMGMENAQYLNIWSLNKTSFLYLFMHMSALQPPTCTAIGKRHVMRCDLWPRYQNFWCSCSYTDKNITTTTTPNPSHVVYFTNRNQNKGATIQTFQYSWAHARWLFWLLCIKDFMINKVLLSGKSVSVVKVLKYFGREEYCRLLDEYLMS